MKINLKERTYEFSRKIVNLVKSLPRETNTEVLKRQLLRAGTSIGANVEEAIAAFSKNDFIHKMSIASKEIREANYWLRLFKDCNLCEKNKELINLLKESEELIKIFTSIVKTSRERYTMSEVKKSTSKTNDYSTQNSKFNEKGFTVWFTGLPCSGKSTIADRVAEILKKKGLKVERLDGDIVRQHLTRDLGFSPEDRNENIRRVTFVAKLLTRNGVAVLSSFVSPYREIRKYAREEIGNFIEVYVKCPVEVCIDRDVKGMYKKAMAGEIKDFTGISAPYEEPENPELILETDKETPEESVEKVIKKLEELNYI